MRIVGVSALLLAGCNAVFGLDPTIPVDAAELDFDHDGVRDELDNCLTLANADQVNADGDAFGDSCDSCPSVASATTHDEDQDGVGDACDLCPGIADFANDSDLDTVGDICDPRPLITGNARLAFEAFQTLPPDWQSTSIEWRGADDAVEPMVVVPMTDAGLVDTALVITPPWHVTIGFESSKPWGVAEQAAISVKLGAVTVRCRLACPTVPCQGTIEKDGSIVGSFTPLDPRPFSRLTMGVDANGSFSCIWDDALAAAAPGFSTSPPATFGVVSSPGVRVTYFEVIR